MKFSIIVPVYNVEVYLKDCLESILTQSMVDYEVICVNDASTDHSLDILQAYEKKYSKIKVINNLVNRGLSFSRNCGIRNATGKYILFVDSDDMLCRDALKELSDESDRFNADILYFNMIIKNEGQWAKERVKLSQKQERHDGIYTGQEFFVKLQQNNQVIVEAWRQLFSKKFLEENNLYFYEGILHEDELFSIICVMKAERVAYLNRELYVYRRRDGSIMSKMCVDRMRSYFIVFIELWKFWHSNTFSAEVNEAFGCHLKQLYCSFKNVSYYFPGIDTLEFGGPAEQFMFSLMKSAEHSRFRYAQLSDVQLKQVKDAEKVIVYGAGTAGIEMIRLLRMENIRVDTIVVSNKDINPENILGIRIEQIDKVAELEQAIIIVAVTEKHREGVTNNLKQLGLLDHAIFMNNKKF